MFSQCAMVAIVTGALVVGASGARSQTNADIAAVIAVNDGSVSTLDPAAMEIVWAHEAYVDNVGPQHKTMQFGWDAIQEAFKNGTIANSAQLTIKPIDPKVHISGNVAWVIGQESADGTLKNGTRVTGTNFAISIFERKDGHWLMVSHHGQRAPQ
jgi:ketosteroid isomerase-like protein